MISFDALFLVFPKGTISIMKNVKCKVLAHASYKSHTWQGATLECMFGQVKVGLTYINYDFYVKKNC